MSMRNLGLLSLLFPSFPPVYFSDTFFFFSNTMVFAAIYELCSIDKRLRKLWAALQQPI